MATISKLKFIQYLKKITDKKEKVWEGEEFLTN